MALSYKVFPGTPYYSNTSLTTKAGEIVNTTAATYVNTTYGTVSVGGSTYYVAYGMMVSFWNSSFTGAQIDDALNKVVNADTTPTANSTKMITSGGVKSAINFVPETGNAGYHNSIYRGKYLGTSVTAAQYAAIDAGTFDDLFIGDYWTIDGVDWRIAHFDYWYNKGDTACTTHHVVIVPDSLLATGVKMNNSNVTTGGYVGSDIYTGNNENTGLSGAKTTINSAFGSSHILSHRELLTNAVTGGKASGWAWYDSTVELMNESMVYGHHAWASALGYETGIDKGQLPLFAHDHSRICNRSAWWLRDVNSAAYFTCVNGAGRASTNAASNSIGVRPAFAIKA